MKFQITGYIELAGKQTAPVRTVVEARSKEEAEAKFKAFLTRKAQPVVQTCQAHDPDWAEIFNLFGEIFK